MDGEPRERSTSEKRHDALEMQLAARRLFATFQERMKGLEKEREPPGVRQAMSRLWWESALAGAVGCALTFAALRRGVRSSVVMSSIGGVLVGNGAFSGRFVAGIPDFVEAAVAQPDRSPLIDYALCPTILELKRLAEAARASRDDAELEADNTPAGMMLNARLWALCGSRAARHGEADPVASDPWAGGGGDDASRFYQPPPSDFREEDDPAARR